MSKRPLFRTLHGLLGYQRSSTLFRPVCLSLDSQSDCLRFFSPPHPPSRVDSLDSELWYLYGCRAAALASSSTLAVGQSFRQLSPRGTRSKGDQQPDGRVAHNQKLSNIFGVDTAILATRVLRARKTRKSSGVSKILVPEKALFLLGPF